MYSFIINIYNGCRSIFTDKRLQNKNKHSLWNLLPADSATALQVSVQRCAVSENVSLNYVSTYRHQRWTRVQLECRRRMLQAHAEPTPRQWYPCHAAAAAGPSRLKNNTALKLLKPFQKQ